MIGWSTKLVWVTFGGKRNKMVLLFRVPNIDYLINSILIPGAFSPNKNE
jgi:hypothetical protein